MDHQHKDSVINGKLPSLCPFSLFYSKLMINFLQEKKVSLTKAMLLFACWFVINPSKLSVTVEDKNQNKEHFSQIRTSSVAHD